MPDGYKNKQPKIRNHEKKKRRSTFVNENNHNNSSGRRLGFVLLSSTGNPECIWGTVARFRPTHNKTTTNSIQSGKIPAKTTLFFRLKKGKSQMKAKITITGDPAGTGAILSNMKDHIDLQRSEDATRAVFSSVVLAERQMRKTYKALKSKFPILGPRWAVRGRSFVFYKAIAKIDKF